MNPPSFISFVIPAHNEEARLAETLKSIQSASTRLTLKYEVVVVDDASTDWTAEVGRSCGARVETVAFRKISAVRNAGARVTSGDVLIFVDADTIVTTRLLRSALNAIARGAVGGGALVAFDEHAALWAKPVIVLWNVLARFSHWAAGCFVFARRDAFEAVGGFDERFFVAEEVVLSEALKQIGHFKILCERPITSSRKTQHYSFFEMLALFWKLGLGGIHLRQQREGLDHWYARRG
ncbi:MAG: glycosyltransferase [Planctomycetes bacterium]|nr:glycosyltransferase [Planctomycetota bacterium]MBI3833551.1 glycosyltransferase [Planctomycetota bacterium]